MNYRDFDRLELILQLIAHIQRRFTGLSERAFLNNKDEIDLTAFRLSAIGEACSKLDGELKGRHSHIDWVAIYGMRNVIVHDYNGIRPERIWEVARGKLNALEAMCRAEIENQNEN